MARSSSGCWVATNRCCAAAIPSGDSPCRSSSSGTLAPRLAQPFFQNFSSSPGTSGAPGTVPPGQRRARPARLAAAIMRQLIRSAVFRLRPAQYADVVHLTESTFQRRHCLGHDPTTSSSPTRRPGPSAFSGTWAGSERSRFAITAIVTRNQWLAGNINEVNIFENGFLERVQERPEELGHQRGGRRDGQLRQPRPAGAGGPPHLHRDGDPVHQRERRQQPAQRRGRHPGQHVGDQPRLRLFDVRLGNPGVRRRRRPGQGLSHQLLAGEPVRHRARPR